MHKTIALLKGNSVQWLKCIRVQRVKYYSVHTILSVILTELKKNTFILE